MYGLHPIARFQSMVGRGLRAGRTARSRWITPITSSPVLATAAIHVSVTPDDVGHHVRTLDASTQRT